MIRTTIWQYEARKAPRDGSTSYSSTGGQEITLARVLQEAIRQATYFAVEDDATVTLTEVCGNCQGAGEITKPARCRMVTRHVCPDCKGSPIVSALPAFKVSLHSNVHATIGTCRDALAYSVAS